MPAGERRLVSTRLVVPVVVMLIGAVVSAGIAKRTRPSIALTPSVMDTVNSTRKIVPPAGATAAASAAAPSAEARFPVPSHSDAAVVHATFGADGMARSASMLALCTLESQAVRKQGKGPARAVCRPYVWVLRCPSKQSGPKAPHRQPFKRASR
jgi:hypothetical protein